MRIRFLKDHLKNNKDDEIDLPYAQADYLIRMQVAEVITEKVEMEPEREKVEFKPVKEKRERKKKE